MDDERDGNGKRGKAVDVIDGPVKRVNAPGRSLGTNEVGFRAAGCGGVGFFPDEVVSWVGGGDARVDVLFDGWEVVSLSFLVNRRWTE